MTVPPGAYLLLSVALFTVGTVGVLVRRTALILFMSIELMLNAVNLAFVTLARVHADLAGQLAAFFVLVVAAVEVVVGLSILVHIFRARDTVDVDEVDLLRG